MATRTERQHSGVLGLPFGGRWFEFDDPKAGVSPGPGKALNLI